jgi:hypothetical protein
VERIREEGRVSFNPDQARDSSGKWTSAGGVALPVPVAVTQPKSGAATDVAYRAGQVAYFAQRIHKHVAAFHAAKTDEERAKAALTATKAMAHMKAALAATKANAKTEYEQKLHQSAKQIAAVATAAHGTTVGAPKQAETPKPPSPADKAAKMQAMHLQDVAEKASLDAVDSAGHHAAMMAHVKAANAFNALGDKESALHHEQNVTAHAAAFTSHKDQEEAATHQKEAAALKALEHQQKAGAIEAKASTPVAPQSTGQSPKPLSDKAKDSLVKMRDAYQDAQIAHQAGDYKTAQLKYQEASAYASIVKQETATPEKNSPQWAEAHEVQQKAVKAGSDIENTQPPQPGGNIPKAYGNAMGDRLEEKATATEKSALSDYTGPGYGAINEALRDGGEHKRAAALDSVLAKGETFDHDVVVHRGVNGQQFYKKLGVGGTYAELSYSSTSFGDKSAFSTHDTQLHMTIAPGIPLAAVKSLSEHSGENEILLPRGLRVTVERMETIGSQLHVHVRVEKMTDSELKAAQQATRTVKLWKHV